MALYFTVLSFVVPIDSSFIIAASQLLVTSSKQASSWMAIYSWFVYLL